MTGRCRDGKQVAAELEQAISLYDAGQYLADWRMTIARDLLVAQEATMGEIAAQTGYSSVYAFATAFRRHHGEPPRRWQAARAGRPAARRPETRYPRLTGTQPGHQADTPGL